MRIVIYTLLFLSFLLNKSNADDIIQESIGAHQKLFYGSLMRPGQQELCELNLATLPVFERRISPHDLGGISTLLKKQLGKIGIAISNDASNVIRLNPKAYEIRALDVYHIISERHFRTLTIAILRLEGAASEKKARIKDMVTMLVDPTMKPAEAAVSVNEPMQISIEPNNLGNLAGVLSMLQNLSDLAAPDSCGAECSLTEIFISTVKPNTYSLKNIMIQVADNTFNERKGEKQISFFGPAKLYGSQLLPTYNQDKNTHIIVSELMPVTNFKNLISSTTDVTVTKITLPAVLWLSANHSLTFGKLFKLMNFPIPANLLLQSKKPVAIFLLEAAPEVIFTTKEPLKITSLAYWKNYFSQDNLFADIKSLSAYASWVALLGFVIFGISQLPVTVRKRFKVRVG